MRPARSHKSEHRVSDVIAVLSGNMTKISPNFNDSGVTLIELPDLGGGAVVAFGYT
jgi:hypothetical protein